MGTNIKVNGQRLEDKFPYEFSYIHKLQLGKRDVVVVRTTCDSNMTTGAKIKYMKGLKVRMEKCLKQVGLKNPVIVMDSYSTNLQLMTPEEIFVEKL